MPFLTISLPPLLPLIPNPVSIQTSRGVLVNHLLGEEIPPTPKLWFVVFAHFHGVNTSTGIVFELLGDLTEHRAGKRRTDSGLGSLRERITPL